MKEKSSFYILKKAYSSLDYILFFLLIQIGWFSILLNIRRIDLAVFVIVFYIFYRRNKEILFDSRIVIIFIIYALLAFVQGLIWGFSLISFTSSFLLGFLMPYYFFKVYKEDFLFILEKIIYFLTIISLVIWIVHQAIPGASELISKIILEVNKYNNSEIARGIIFYTYWPRLDQDIGISRNAGFRSEPGAFAVFIILAIVINYVRNIKLYDRRNIIYYIALLSTFSTAGYLALAALGLLLIKQKSFRLAGIILFPILAFAASYAYNNLDFMKSKINQQYEIQTEVRLNEPTSGRFLGARKSLFVLSKYPLYGRGLLSRTKPTERSDPEYTEYGWLHEMSRFGIIFGGLFMFFFLRGLYYFVRSGGNGLYEYLVCSMSILINLSSQTYITSPYFMIFFFMGLYKFNWRNFKYDYINSKLNNSLATRLDI